MAEGAGGKMEERGNNATSRYTHKMEHVHVHELKCRLQHSLLQGEKWEKEEEETRM